MADRVDVYSGDELVGTVPMPELPPGHTHFEGDRFNMRGNMGINVTIGEPSYNLGIKRSSFSDIAASVVTFEIKWHTDKNGWVKRAALHCSPMFGPGDWECIPGFRHVRVTTAAHKGAE